MTTIEEKNRIRDEIIEVLLKNRVRILDLKEILEMVDEEYKKYGNGVITCLKCGAINLEKAIECTHCHKPF